jgi:hypothetical protein
MVVTVNKKLDYPILDALPSMFLKAMQFDASCTPTLTSPLMVCFCLFVWTVVVLLLSANAGDANVPITTAAATKTAVIVNIVVLFISARFNVYIIMVKDILYSFFRIL